MTMRTYAHSPASACLRRHVDALVNRVSERIHESRAGMRPVPSSFWRWPFSSP